MAERNLPQVIQASGETIDYKPLSPLAVAGLGVAVLYAVIVLASAVAAFVKSEPFFMGGWSLALPIAGAVLSGLGLWQIHGAEGTRAGAGLAKWGIGISLVIGIGYLTYQIVTGLAILHQANRFLMEKGESAGFFPRLQGNEADIRTAFRFTLDISESGADIVDLDRPFGQSPKGKLTAFMEHPLVRLMGQGTTATTKVAPLAVHTWDYENGAYHVTRGYRITTEEGVYEVPIKVASVEPTAEGEGRKWRVVWLHMANPPPVSRTDLGIRRQALRQKALEFLSDAKSGWFPILIQRRSLAVYLAMQRPAQREELRQKATAIARTPVTGLAGGAMAWASTPADDVAIGKILKGFKSLTNTADYFKMDDLRVWDRNPKTLAKVREAATEALAWERLPYLSFKVLPNELAACAVEQGEVNITCNALFVVSITDESTVPLSVLVELEVVVAASEDIDPQRPDAAQQWYIKTPRLVGAWPLPREKQ